MTGLAVIFVAFAFGLAGGFLSLLISGKAHTFASIEDMKALNKNNWESMKQYVDLKMPTERLDLIDKAMLAIETGIHELDRVNSDLIKYYDDLNNSMVDIGDEIDAHIKWSMGIWNDICRKHDILRAGDHKIPSEMEKLADQYAEEVKTFAESSIDILPMGPKDDPAPGEIVNTAKEKNRKKKRGKNGSDKQATGD